MGKNNGAESAQASLVRHGKLRRSSSWGNALRVFLTTALVVTLSGIATIAYASWDIGKDVHTVDLGKGTPEVAAGTESIDGALTILLVGSDTREGQSFDDGEEGELNDVTMLLHVSADHQNATVVSFPRDLMLPIPSCPGPNGEEDYYAAMSEQQLNSAMSYGGLPCVVRTVEELTGMEIPYAALITFDGVIGISNAIGGVEVCLNQPIVDPYAGLDLPAGNSTLVGWDALQFLRTRHGVGDGGDTSRISNQQVFMSSLVRKLKSADTLSDPVKVYSLAKAAVENMTLSSNMTGPEFIQAAAGTVKDIDLDHINFVQYPSFTHPYESGRLRPDYNNGQLLFDVIKSGQSFSVTGVGEGVEVEGSDPATEDPNAPVEDPNAPVEDPAAPTEGVEAGGETTPTTDPDGRVQLPESITGVQSDKAICSQGRTVF